MVNFIRKTTAWRLQKEVVMAKSCAVPMHEIESQLQKDYDSSIVIFNDMEAKLEKINSALILRCQKKVS